MTSDLHHLAAAYALDALDERERTEFEAHYPACDICRDEVEQFRETAGLLAGASVVTPPSSLKESVLGEISRNRQLSPIDTAERDRRGHRFSSRFSSSSLLASAAAIVALVVGAALMVSLRDGRSPVEEVLAAPDAVVTTLEVTPDGSGGTFQVVWSAERDRVAVLGNDLPDPGPDRVYELWAIVGDTPVPAGLFDPDDGSLRAAAAIDDVDAAAWGVTIEPDGGSPSPTTPILFFGEA